MKVRDLPVWPPSWVTTGSGPYPMGAAGVLHSVRWREDPSADEIDLVLVINYEGRSAQGIYPGTSDVRGKIAPLGGKLLLHALHDLLQAHLGERMADIQGLDLPTLGRDD